MKLNLLRLLSCVVFLFPRFARGDEKTSTAKPLAKSAEPTSSSATLPDLRMDVQALDDGWAKRHLLHKANTDFLKSIMLRKDAELPTDAGLLWRLGRLAYYTGVYSAPKSGMTDEDVRVGFFEFGTKVSRLATEKAPARVEGYFWLASNLALICEVRKSMSALKLADQAKEALDKAVTLDGSYFYGGPHRVRGLLYDKLPGGFISFGDNKKAEADYRRAAEIAPDYFLNWTYLALIEHKRDKDDEALAAAKKARGVESADNVGVEEDRRFSKELTDLLKELSK